MVAQSVRLDIGIASYESPDKLCLTIDLIRQHSTTDWRLFIVDNASPDPAVRAVIEAAAAVESRIVPIFLDTNTGYAGAVNHIIEVSETELVAYVDNDCYIRTPGWDQIMASYLERHHELAMVFSKDYCSYPIDRGPYIETLWGLGCFWMLKRLAKADVGLFDQTLGHQEEVDYQMRLRLKGWRLASAREVTVEHLASSATNPAAQERIGQGVVRWMNKWLAYFCGPQITYHHPSVLRFEDWPSSTLHLEQFFKLHLPADFNMDPEVVTIAGREYDLIKVPRLKNLYRGRII